MTKDASADRAVFNRMPRNGKEGRADASPTTIASGPDFCRVRLQRGSTGVLVWATDCADMYPSFTASEARARTNIVNMPCELSVWKHTSAYHEFRQRRPDYHGPVVPGGASCFMGDLNAPDWAQNSHGDV